MEMTVQERYFTEEFNPLVYPREYLVVYYRPTAGEWSIYTYKVRYVYPMIPFIMELDDINPGSTSSVSLDNYEPKSKNQIYHLRFEPLDDIEIILRGTSNSAYYVIKDTELTFGSNYTDHHVEQTISTADTPTAFWSLTSGRKARVTELAITNNSGSDAVVYLTDSTGSKKYSAPIKVTAGETVVATPDDYLLDTYINEDIYVISTQAPVDVVGTIHELGKGFDPRFAEVVFMKGMMPTMKVRNPTNVVITSPKIRFFGYEYLVEPVPKSPEELEKYSILILTR